MSNLAPERRTRRLRTAAVLAGAGALASVAAVAPQALDTIDADNAAVQAGTQVTPERLAAKLDVAYDQAPSSSPLSDRLLIAASKEEVETAPEPEQQAAEAAPAEPAPEPQRSVWDQVADCESGDWTGDGGFVTASADWAATAGTFEGGLQFHPGTWDGYKDPGMPEAAYQASREQQIAVAERVLADQGWSAWPVCSRKLGLR